jgi:hypothetical protein
LLRTDRGKTAVGFCLVAANMAEESPTGEATAAPQLLLVSEHLQPWRRHDWPVAHELMSLQEFVGRETDVGDEVSHLEYNARTRTQRRVHLNYSADESRQIVEALRLLSRIDPQNWGRAAWNPSEAILEIVNRWRALALELGV